MSAVVTDRLLRVCLKRAVYDQRAFDLMGKLDIAPNNVAVVASGMLSELQANSLDPRALKVLIEGFDLRCISCGGDFFMY